MKKAYFSSDEEKDQKKIDIEKKLVDGVKSVLSSENWKGYLKLQSKFHKYSFSNVMLISVQNPDATKVAGFKAWQTLGRSVKKGEHGISIFGFSTYKYFMDTVDGVMKVCYLKNATAEQRSRIERGQIELFNGKSYPLVSVFDVGQTEGKDLPSGICTSISGDSEQAKLIIDILTDLCDIPVREEKMKANGCFSPSGQYICLKEGLSMNHKSKTFVHEYAHYYLDKQKKSGVLDLSKFTIGNDDKDSLYAVEEIIVESIAFITGEFYGVDSSEYSFEYITSWSSGNVDRIKEVGSIIQKYSDEIIDSMEKIHLSYISESEVIEVVVEVEAC